MVSFFDIPYNSSETSSAFPTVDTSQLNLAVASSNSGPFSLTIGLIQLACSSSSVVTINTISPHIISSQIGDGYYTNGIQCQVCSFINLFNL